MGDKININGINFKIENCPSKEIQKQIFTQMKNILNKYSYSLVVDTIYKPEISEDPKNKELLDQLNEIISKAGIEYVALLLISFRHRKKIGLNAEIDDKIKSKKNINSNGDNERNVEDNI